MLSDNGTFTIDTGASHSQIKEIHEIINKNIKNIKVIDVKGVEDLQSSALLSLLYTIKVNKPNISIPVIDNNEGALAGLGKFVIIDKNNNYE